MGYLDFDFTGFNDTFDNWTPPPEVTPDYNWSLPNVVPDYNWSVPTGGTGETNNNWSVPAGGTGAGQSPDSNFWSKLLNFGNDNSKLLGLLGSIGAGAGKAALESKNQPKNQDVYNQLKNTYAPTLSQMQAGYQNAGLTSNQLAQWQTEMQNMGNQTQGRNMAAQSLLGLITTDPSLKNAPETDLALALLKKRSTGDPEELRRLLAPLIGPSTRGNQQVSDITSDYASNMEKQYTDALLSAGTQRKASYSDWMGKIGNLYQQYASAIGPDEAAKRLALAGYPADVIRSIQSQYAAQMNPFASGLSNLYSAGQPSNAILSALSSILGGVQQGLTTVPTTDNAKKIALLSQLLNLG